MNRYLQQKDINSTYTLDEAEIEINRPNIDFFLNEKLKRCNNNILEICELKKHQNIVTSDKYQTYSTEISVKKQSASKNEIIKNLKIIPKIIISDYGESSKLIETSNTKSDLDYVRKKVVEEMNIDQFHQDLSIKTNPNYDDNKYVYKKNDRLSNVYESSHSNSNLSSCVSICKTARPANIEIELFDCFDNNVILPEENSQNMESNDLNNNNLECDNKNNIYPTDLKCDEIKSKLKPLKNNFYIYENDEYNFNNLKSIKLSNSNEQDENVDENEKIINTQSTFKIAVKSILSNTHTKINFKDANLNYAYDKFQTEITRASISRSTIELNLNYEHNFENYFLYVSFEKFQNIFKKRCIDLETFFYNSNLINGIIFLTLPPESNDLILLKHLYGSNALIDLSRIEGVIKLKRNILERNKKHLIKLDKFKYAFTKRIVFGRNFPKHEFRPKFGGDHN